MKTANNIYALSKQMILQGVKHVVVDCTAKECIAYVHVTGVGEATAVDEATAIQINFKTSSERAKQRRKSKQYRLKNKSRLKLKRKQYERKMKHKKPNRLRSQIMKKVHDRYNY